MKFFRGFVSYGREKIEFRYSHVDRKTLEIAILPDQRVVVKAPLGTDPAEVKRRVTKRASWIIRQQKFFRQFEPRTPRRSYVGGETHLYHGKRYRLKIRSGSHDEIKLLRGFFEIQVRGRVASEKVKSLLEEWYKKRADVKFNESLDRCLLFFKKQKLQRPKLHIRRLKKRWGSLSNKGTLTLNADLIRAPEECIDYVVVHELCHLRYKDHGPKFFKLLERIIPDWKDRKKKLELTMV